MSKQRQFIESFHPFFTVWAQPLFQEKEYKKQIDEINKTLLHFIQNQPTPCFLLPALLAFIEEIRTQKIVDGDYSLPLFELWLNQHSALSFEENLLIRGKIVGRYLPREEYQTLFPIGMNLLYDGPHFIAAHASPDVDTTVASFIGWLDAFGARVSKGIHYWVLPDGFSDGYTINLFKRELGEQFWNLLPKKEPTSAFSSIDLMSEIPHSSNEATFLHEKAETLSLQGKKATISLRDFSSRDEASIAEYIDIISIIDHHKSAITTHKPSTITVADVQSCNTIVEEISTKINEQWSNPKKSPFFVDRSRQIFEITIAIIAILDDTDLLNKVSRRDLLLLKELVNRYILLSSEKEKELLSFDEIAEDGHFNSNCRRALLTNQTLYRIYKEAYAFKEREIEEMLSFEVQKKVPSPLFRDTKEQNGNCRIGQIKLFTVNIGSFQEKRKVLIEQWSIKSQEAKKRRETLNFFLQMISTIPGASEAYSGRGSEWNHRDEIWIFSPEGQEKQIACFLSRFIPAMNSISIQIFTSQISSHRITPLIESALEKVDIIYDSTLPDGITCLSFPAGKINSRKAQIAPFLPT